MLNLDWKFLALSFRLSTCRWTALDSTVAEAMQVAAFLATLFRSESIGLHLPKIAYLNDNIIHVLNIINNKFLIF